MIVQADIGVARDIVFNMLSMAVFRLVRDPEKRQYIHILGLKTRNARPAMLVKIIGGGKGALNEAEVKQSLQLEQNSQS